MAWVFEDKFNSDTKSTGDLNGQDGWSGGTGTDIVTTTPYEGDQCVSGGDEAVITNTFTAVNSGVVYFAMRRSNNNSGDSEMDFRANSNTQLKIRITFNGTGGRHGIVEITNGASVSDVIASYSVDQWYLFELTINSNDTHDIRYHNGSSWSTPITGLAAATGVTADIDAVRITGGTPGATLYDYISPTNPFGGASGPANLKLYNTNLKANIKSINTNLIANCKSLNTNV